jgi:hypothetical protein
VIGEVTVSERLHMPSLGGATGWLNSEPLGPAELRGHVVLVNFWTLTCINWLPTKPYIGAWSRAYRNDGLVENGPASPRAARAGGAGPPFAAARQRASRR